MEHTKRIVRFGRLQRLVVGLSLITATVVIPSVPFGVPAAHAAPPVLGLYQSCGTSSQYGSVYQTSASTYTCRILVSAAGGTSGTYTVPSAVPTWFTVIAIGGGGGGGGVWKNNSYSGWGSPGSYASVQTSTRTLVYSVGRGGAAGSTPPTNDSNGACTAGSNGVYTNGYVVGADGGSGALAECYGFSTNSNYRNPDYYGYGNGGSQTYCGNCGPLSGNRGFDGAVLVQYEPPQPGAPTSVTVANTAGSFGRADVSWTPPVDTTFVTRYVATATSSDGGTTKTCSSSMSSYSVTPTCQLTGLTLGKTYTVSVTGYTALDTASSASSTSNSVLVPSPPTNTVAPTIDPAYPVVGGTMTRTEGTWTTTMGTVTLSGQWVRMHPSTLAETDIAGETGPSYVVTAADLGYRLMYRETADNGTATATAMSSATAVVVGQPAFTTNSPPTETATNQLFSYTFVASGGGVTYSLVNSDLPGTITLSGGTLSGTPTAAGSYSYTVRATNTAGTDDTTHELHIGRTSVLGTSSTNETSGDTFSVSPTVTLATGAVPGSSVSVTAAIQTSPGGSPTLGGTLTRVTDGSGVATFAGLVITGAAGSYTIRFSASGWPNADLTVTLGAGTAAGLSITSQPVGGVNPGATLATVPVVTVVDSAGNTITSSSAQITAVVASGSVNATLSPDTATASSGVATFTGMAVNGAGGDFTLTFSSPGLSSVTSNLFSINRTAQTITFTYGGGNKTFVSPDFSVSASTSPSQLTVAFSSGTPQVCGVSGDPNHSSGTTNATVSILGIGTCTIHADQLGDDMYLPATRQSVNVTVSAGPVSVVGSTVTTAASSLVADGTSNTTITVTMKDIGGHDIGSSQGIVSLSATSGTLGAVTDHNDGTYSATFTAPAERGSGTSVISATLGGTAMSGTATITLLTAQTISFVQSSVSLGIAPFSLTATASSGLSVSFSLGGATTNSACTVSSSGVVTVLAVGDCQVLADQTGNSVFAAAPQVSQTFAVQPSTPTAPFITSVTPGNTTTSVAFAVPGFDGGATITDYEYSIDGGATWLSAGSATSPLTISGLTNGTAYTIVIRAVNTAGAGLASAPSSSFAPSVAGGAPVTTSATTPSAPRDLVVLTGSGTSVTLHWKVPVSDGGSSLTGYVVNSTPSATCTVTTNSAAGTATCSASGLTAGQAYSFMVSAVNAVGVGTAATVAYAVPGGSGGGSQGGSGGSSGGGSGTPGDTREPGGECQPPSFGAASFAAVMCPEDPPVGPGGPSAPPLPGTDDDGDGLPDPWRPVVDPNNVPGRPCSGCVQLFPAPGDDGSPGTGGSGGSGGNGGSDGGTSRPGVTSTPPGSKPGTIKATTGTGTTIVIGGNDSGGKPATSTSTNGGLVVESPGNVPIVLSGLKPGSTVTVWLADNLSVTGVVGPDGTVVLSAPIPTGLEAGTYTGRVDMIDADGVARSLLFGFEWRGLQGTLPVTGSDASDLLVIVMWLFVAGILIRASSRRRYLCTDCHGSIL